MNRKLFRRFALLGGAALAMATVGWAKTYHMTASTDVPGAAANLSVGKQKNGNLQIELKADHLAKPGRLTPPASSYIVWLQQEGAQPQSQGELKIGNDLKGELKASTHLNNFKLFVTAESDAQATAPSEQVVLRTTVQE